MNIAHLKYLRDPISRQPLRAVNFSRRGKDLISGLLISGSGWYPVIAGVPRLLTGPLFSDCLKQHGDFFVGYRKKMPVKIRREWERLAGLEPDSSRTARHQISTGASFAFEWERIYRENSYERDNYFHFLAPYINPDDLVGRTVVDLGCGSGRFTKQAALAKAKIVVGMDVGESVDTAYRLCRKLKNVLIVQGDIYHPPFLPVFDIAHSIGVLHHLPDPRAGFLACCRTVVKNGLILIWVYNRRNNNRAINFYEPLRSFTRLLPKPLLYKLCYLPAGVVHMINLLTKTGKNPPFGYYRNFPFNMKLNDAFDVLSTPKSNYYYVEDIIDWFKSAKLKRVQAYEHPEAGITCIGHK